ncbi:RNA methyltransferase [Rhodococcus oxybenzonivorans]|uniref:RNA methyltransferase n=1 Tax=Rhodococcus oxybenzonivorans TaxID=1990687 RepID=A0A2S2BV12_9NOCA|nr:MULTISPECIES: RNA methyltransferase [Rhodococcus]AWK72368.1 RNA methyltransferase [Rhodococcus oxybenzonivorans]QTJ64568.1 RNA methyltransferase [Rhodococcus sp. ZPP]
MDPLTERTPRVVSAVKLLRTAERRKAGRFLVEGENAVGEALGTRAVHDLFYTEGALQRYAELIGRAETIGVRTSLVTDRAVRGLSDTVTPPGLVAVCDLLDVPLPEAVGPGTRLLAVPVAVAEPGNAGTVIRVADAVGADAAILAGDSVDPHNGKCVRASAGSLFHLPLVRERNTALVLDAISAAGIQLLATAADGEVDLDDADDLLSRPTAWLFGNEAHGLDVNVAARADHRVRIPIHGRAESLNLATAAAICLYSSARVQNRTRTDS